MRCPNPTCRREIPLDALEHPVCGWRSSSAPPAELDLEPPPTPPERMLTRDEMRANVARFRTMAARIMAAPQPSPIDRWRAVLANPKSTYTAKEMAKEALRQLERSAAFDEEVRKRRATRTEAHTYRENLPPTTRPSGQGAMDSLDVDALEREFMAERAANASRETAGSTHRPYRSGSRRA